MDSYSFDTINEEEVTIGASTVEDSLANSMLYMSSIMDSNIHMLDLSYPMNTSLVDGVQLSFFLDVFSARSSIICVLPRTIHHLMCFDISSLVPDINNQILLEDFEHLFVSSFHTSIREDSL